MMGDIVGYWCDDVGVGIVEVGLVQLCGGCLYVWLCGDYGVVNECVVVFEGFV